MPISFLTSRARHRRNTSAVLLIGCALSLGSLSFAHAEEQPERKIALIVGNGDYDVLADLPNAPNDAALVDTLLTSVGFETVLIEDADFAALSDALIDVAGRADETSTVVFYYAGHGLQVGAGNFILPADSRIEGIHDLPFAALSLSHIMSILSARAEKTLFILDSCRDNPFFNELVVNGVSNDTVPVEAGFYFQRGPINSFVAFSTSPGELAYDGEPGSNSPFTDAFVAHARTNPGAEINALMASTRRDVHAATDGKQLPWETSSLTAAMSLARAPEQGEAVAALSDGGDAGSREASVSAEGVGPQQIAIDVQFEREIPIGIHLASESLQGSISLLDVPKSGELTVVAGGAVRVLGAEDVVPLADLPSLTYRPDVTRFSPVGLETFMRTDRFSLAAAGQTVDVDLGLEFHRCDLRAGGVLDLQGVGAEVHPHEMRPLEALDACRDAVASDPANLRFHAQLARALIASGEFDAARDALEIAFEGGYIRAAQRLGIWEITAQAQRDGMVQQAAPPAALDYLETGVELGDPLADYTLGRELLRYGTSDAARDRSYSLLTRAHSAGYIEAMNELGRYFLQTDSENRNPARALRYFEATADRGNINGQNSIGIIYRNGLGGVERDTERAAAAFEAAVDGGHPGAPNVLAIMYEDGDGVTQNFERALSLFDIGLDRGDPWAGTNGARLIMSRPIPGTTPFDAAYRAGRAAALGGGDAATSARTLLESLPARAIAGGTQKLLADLGATIAVDGDFGAASRAAMNEVLARTGAALPDDTPIDRLLAVATAHWNAFGFRTDLL